MRRAIEQNEDVTGAGNDWLSLWTHDLWGKELISEDSHKSYRPLTTMSFKIDALLYGQNASGCTFVDMYLPPSELS